MPRRWLCTMSSHSTAAALKVDALFKASDGKSASVCAVWCKLCRQELRVPWKVKDFNKLHRGPQTKISFALRRPFQRHVDKHHANIGDAELRKEFASSAYYDVLLPQLAKQHYHRFFLLVWRFHCTSHRRCLAFQHRPCATNGCGWRCGACRVNGLRRAASSGGGRHRQVRAAALLLSSHCVTRAHTRLPHCSAMDVEGVDQLCVGCGFACDSRRELRSHLDSCVWIRTDACQARKLCSVCVRVCPPMCLWGCVRREWI